MERKYQVFISSTYEDLKDERKQAIKAVLEMGHIPVGMEMFSAADEEQWALIAKKIEETDYYVLIAGHRYGSETKEGISYTEKEYDYAVSKGVPTLGFIIDENTSWPANRIDKDPEKVEKLNLFKSKVKRKLVQSWCDKGELHGKISISLMHSMNNNPRAGWVRSDLVESVHSSEIEVFSSRDEWLKKVMVLESSSSLIGTLHYSDHPEDLGGRSNEYFEKSNALIKDRSKDVVYRRIATVANKEKAQWILSTIEEMSQCDNFSISVIYVNHDEVPLLCLHVGCKEGKFYNFVFNTLETTGTISAYLVNNDSAGSKSYEAFNHAWAKSMKLKEGSKINIDNVKILAEMFGLTKSPEYESIIKMVGKST